MNICLYYDNYLLYFYYYVTMPIVKLFGVLVRTLSKPISVWIKGHLNDSPGFGKAMTIVGRKYQKLTNFMSGNKTTRELDQNMAISLGSEIVVEGIFFGIAGGLILYDHAASKIKSSQLEARLKKLEDKCFVDHKNNEPNIANKQNEKLSQAINNIDMFTELIQDHMETFDYQ